MERLLNKLFVIAIVLWSYSCKPTKEIAVDCQFDKIKFELTLFKDNGYDNKTNQPIDYEFCIPDNETNWNEVLAINPSLKKASSKGRSNCKKGELLVIGNTDNKAFKSMLCKIANLGYVKEVNQIFWE
ncbi:MAG: hypothetical protein COA97_11020 [Flavobacteriales bacterium]|nr:MAG: hypothetical protein COA97_11020 [Flavobacteriales bacterium]